MRPIPAKLRKFLADDESMNHCSVCGCYGTQWHHAFEYARRQVNEYWAIVPLCVYHHQNLDKIASRKWGLSRIVNLAEEKAKYPKADWWSSPIYCEVLKENV